MNKYFLIVLGIISIVGIGYFVFSGDATENNDVANEVNANVPATVSDVPEIVVADEQDAEVNSNTPVQSTVTPEMIVESEQNSTTVTAGSYESYSAEKIALAEASDVVIFFHATWCPSCRALNTDIEKNVDAIPQGVAILKADYDKETDLKKKYGVTTQHTLVQVDTNGDLIKKWSGGSKLENLLAEIQ